MPGMEQLPQYGRLLRDFPKQEDCRKYLEKDFAETFLKNDRHLAFRKALVENLPEDRKPLADGSERGYRQEVQMWQHAAASLSTFSQQLHGMNSAEILAFQKQFNIAPGQHGSQGELDKSVTKAVDGILTHPDCLTLIASAQNCINQHTISTEAQADIDHARASAAAKNSKKDDVSPSSAGMVDTNTVLILQPLAHLVGTTLTLTTGKDAKVHEAAIEELAQQLAKQAPHLVRDPQKLQQAADKLAQLEKNDPATARKLLEGYFHDHLLDNAQFVTQDQAAKMLSKARPLELMLVYAERMANGEELVATSADKVAPSHATPSPTDAASKPLYRPDTAIKSAQRETEMAQRESDEAPLRRNVDDGSEVATSEDSQPDKKRGNTEPPPVGDSQMEERRHAMVAGEVAPNPKETQPKAPNFRDQVAAPSANHVEAAQSAKTSAGHRR